MRKFCTFFEEKCIVYKLICYFCKLLECCSKNRWNRLLKRQ